jgi:hypothetical protein
MTERHDEAGGMLSTIATAIRDVRLSATGDETTFILVTKHSGDIAVTIPTGALAPLLGVAPSRSVPPPSTDPLPAQRDQTTDALAALNRLSKSQSPHQVVQSPTPGGAAAGAKPGPPAPTGAVTVSVAEKWMVAVDKQRRLLITVLNLSLPSQHAFALSYSTGLEYAEAIKKQVSAVGGGGTEGTA